MQLKPIFSPSEVQAFRKDTPGCNHVTHLNSAGASLMPQSVIDTIKNHIDLEGNIGGYEASDLRARSIESFYTQAAQLLKAHPRNIAFTANATDSFNRAISSVQFKPGDVILTSNEDYISNQITYLSFIKRFGIKLIRAASLPTGGVDLDDLRSAIVKHNPRLVSITHIPTNSGLVQPVKEIGNLCKQYGILYLIDACQSIGQTELNVNELHCDFLSVTSRKFLRGPRGAGFLFISDRVLEEGLEPLFIDMRGADWVEPDVYVPRNDGKRFEDWEFAYALLLGTGAAIEYLTKLDIHKVEKQIKFLADYLRNGLGQIQGITTYDLGVAPGGLVTFHLRGNEPEALKEMYRARQINVVTSYRNFAVIDYDYKNVPWTIRVSPHYFNTIEEVDYFLEVTSEIAGVK